MSDADETMGDEVYQPQPGDAEEVTDDAALMDPQDTLDERGIDPAIDEGYSPPEKPLAAFKHGTTAAEQRERESLEERLGQEEPDVPEIDEQRSGRLVGSDEGVPHPQSVADDTIAGDAGISGGAASAEEAAVHVSEDPAGIETSEAEGDPGASETGRP